MPENLFDVSAQDFDVIDNSAVCTALQISSAHSQLNIL